MNYAVSIVPGLSLLLGGALLAGAVALSRKERRIRRVQLPARLMSKILMPPGHLLTVEFPGPDGAPRQTIVMSARRRGLGATPEFQGWVWVNADDPSDVIVRPRARLFWPVMLTVSGSVIIAGGLIVTAILVVVRSIDSMPGAR